MTTFARGVAKTLAIAKETAFGTQSSATAKFLRRVSSDLFLSKDSYESQEILTSQQIRDARHGVRRASGTLGAQLSPGAYNDMFEGMLRGTWTAGVSVNKTAVIIDTVNKTITCASPNWVTDGFRRGDVINLSAITGGGAANNNVNLRVANVSSTFLTLYETPPSAIASPGTTATIAVVGKKVMMPATGQVFRSYTVEHWFDDLGLSELFVGCRVSQLSLNMPASGLVSFSASLTGQDMITGSSQIYSTATASTSDNSLAAVNGRLAYAGADLGVITGMSLQIATQVQANPVLGSNVVPEIFQGTMRVNGSFTAMFTDETLMTQFLQETEVELMLYMTSDTSPNSHFMSIYLPRVKAMSASKSDGDMSLVQSFNFVALEKVPATGAGIDATSIVVQDSSA